MRIGILTFHAQLNYGGVLQCWALKKVLESLGHEVVVVDRWMDPANEHLCGRWRKLNGKERVRFVLQGLLGGGQFGQCVRLRRTQAFVKALGLTAYHFYRWSEAPRELDVDCLVVGSDQVWHGGDWGWPDVYLLEGAPSVPAIAYAASFGMDKLPPACDYARGFRRFRAISVREAAGQELVESTGIPAAHVVDPTLLLPPENWTALGRTRKRPKTVVCYIVNEKVDGLDQHLSEWASRTGRRVTIIGECREMRIRGLTPAGLLRLAFKALRHAFCPARVSLRTDDGPREFYRAMAGADECITNSFHAVMFSCICRCNVRFVRPIDPVRQTMFVRVVEWAQNMVRGNFLCDTLADATESLDRDPPVSFNEEEIARRRCASLDWLRTALAGLVK